jgi:hypothetical protein
MRTRLWALAAVGAALTLSSAAAAETTKPAAPKAASCDRACLVDLMQRWVDALPKHSAAGLPISPSIRFTEQAAALPVGDGLFVSATDAPTTFKIFVADPTSGQVGFFGMMKQWGKPILLAARLKVAGGKITEAEHVFAADIRPNGLANLETPRPGLLEDVPAGHRTSRARMAQIADSYFDSIEQDSGGVAPYAEDCVRHENGMQTTTQKTPQQTPLDNASPAQANAFATIGRLGCHDAMNSHVLQYITMIRPRHMLIIDEQKGIVFGFPRFVHRGDVRNLKIVGVPGVDSMPLAFGPNDLQAAEMFKITDGKIHEIEANGFINAYMAPTGWDDRYPETYRYGVVHPKTHPRKVGTTSHWSSAAWPPAGP